MSLYPFYLAPKDYQTVKDILKKNIPDRQVVVFGSRAIGTQKPHSDLDLCVMGDSPLSFAQRAELREAFSESNLPIRVDIVDWAGLSLEFKNSIKEQCVPF